MFSFCHLLHINQERPIRVGDTIFSGESDDDYEDLLAAAKAASNTSSMDLERQFFLSPLHLAIYIFSLTSIS